MWVYEHEGMILYCLLLAVYIDYIKKNNFTGRTLFEYI